MGIEMNNYAHFCDYVRVSQKFDFEVPVLTDETIHYIDPASGELRAVKNSPFKHEGSHSTSVHVQTNGNRISLAGNVGRFGREDNLYNYSIEDTKRICNNILRNLGLPEFTGGKFLLLDSGRKTERQTYTGAEFSRIDVTENFSLGRNDALFMKWLAGQKVTRSKHTAYGNGECVYWGINENGNASKYKIAKCYIKSTEMYEHSKTKYPSKYWQRIVNWCVKKGIVRYEVEFKERFLNQKNLKAWHLVTNDSIAEVYELERQRLVKRIEVDMSLNELSRKSQWAYHAYMSGADMSRIPRSTFYRYRREILRIGVDIASPHTSASVTVLPRIVDVRAARAPNFYKLPKVA